MFDKYYNNGQPTELDFFAIVLDGKPVAVPYMGAVLDTGTATIQGTFTQSQADNLANVLNYGALPLTFTPQSVQSISAQLGSSQLQAGLLAGAIGIPVHQAHGHAAGPDQVLRRPAPAVRA